MVGVIQLLANTAGIIRGCLANLGIQASVVGESTNLPQGTGLEAFTIHLESRRCADGVDFGDVQRVFKSKSWNLEEEEFDGMEKHQAVNSEVSFVVNTIPSVSRSIDVYLSFEMLETRKKEREKKVESERFTISGTN